MDILLVALVLVAAIGFSLIYLRRGNVHTDQNQNSQTTDISRYVIDDKFGVDVLPVVVPEKPAKKAKPNLVKVEGGTSKKPSATARKPAKTIKPAKSKATEPKKQVTKSKKPKTAKKPTDK